MKVGVLTSSRADFGIYLPLLLKLANDPEIDLNIIAFGTHLLKSHGYTLDEIEHSGLTSIDKIKAVYKDDSPKGISETYAETCLKFSAYWPLKKYDVVFCLGDRFEMQAAVQSGIPMRVRFAHIHGGETTEGAIDNIYRHQISLASTMHFTSTEFYAKRVYELTKSKNIYNVGSLSLDEFDQLKLPSMEHVSDKFNIPSKGYILATFHSETASFDLNELYVYQMIKGLKTLLESHNIVITMPNADTLGSLYRKELLKLADEYENIYIVESLGKLNFFTTLKNALCVLGNSSSGIIEAATFGKYVVNVGDRQKGRIQSYNVLNTAFEANQMVKQVETAIAKGIFKGDNIYFKKEVASSIINLLKGRLANARL